jgi:hypothetical protein
MSKRRKQGDWVVIGQGSGFYSGGPLIGQIDPYEPEKYKSYCMLDCGDNDCREWANIYVPGPDGTHKGDLYHVSECQMSDIPENWEPPKDWDPPNIHEKD